MDVTRSAAACTFLKACSSKPGVPLKELIYCSGRADLMVRFAFENKE
jgi:hypothetical protein